jgi:hypothetical protein
MGNLNVTGVPADVRNRILNYLNHVPNARWLAGREPSHGPILDDPGLGYGDGVADYDIGVRVARRILHKRDSRPDGQFTSLNQLKGIDYFGQDKFNDLVYTFSRYWELFLNVNIYSQTTGYYCGAASAQMILDYLHGWGGNPQLTQDNLYNIIQNHKTDNNFYTDPDGLKGCLNQESPAANRWIVHSGNNVEVASRKLIVTMNAYDSPPAALIYDGDHWVVVSGVTATESPSMNKPSFIIYTIEIKDPAGAGNTRDIEYHTWKTTFFTPNTWGTTWDNKYVGVVDPKVKASKNIRSMPPNVKTKGKKMISTKEAQKSAQESIADYHLLSKKAYKRALSGASPGKPILVKNLRLKTKRYYYLVPFVKRGKTTVVFMINAYYGNYLGSSVVDKPKGYLDISKSKAKSLAVKDLKKRVSVEKKDVEQAYLIWKPCKLSWDPFSPIWKTKTKGKIRYISQEKQVRSDIRRVRKGGM